MLFCLESIHFNLELGLYAIFLTHGCTSTSIDLDLYTVIKYIYTLIKLTPLFTMEVEYNAGILYKHTAA